MTSARGFTLIELLIAMFVSAVVSVAGWGFYRAQLQSLSDQAAQLEATEAARAGMSFMTRELRLTGLDPNQSLFGASGGLDVAEATRIRFRLDRDGDGTIDASLADPQAEVIEYAYNMTDRRVERTVSGSLETLIPNVPAGGFTLTYLDRDGTALPFTGSPPALSATDRDQVAIVRVTLQVQASTVRPSNVTLTSRTSLRNRVLDRL